MRLGSNGPMWGNDDNGIVVIAALIVGALLLALFVNHGYLSPIIKQ